MARVSTISELGDEVVLPLHEEELQVAKQRVVTGRVKISTVTRSREALVEQLLTREDVEIERRPVGKTVDRAPQVRQSGNTVIIPVVEEVVRVVRRLVVKEEIRIRLVHRKEKRKHRITVRKQEAVINRVPAEPRGPPYLHTRAEPTNRVQQNKVGGE